MHTLGNKNHRLECHRNKRTLDTPSDRMFLPMDAVRHIEEVATLVLCDYTLGTKDVPLVLQWEVVAP